MEDRRSIDIRLILEQLGMPYEKYAAASLETAAGSPEGSRNDTDSRKDEPPEDC